MCSQSVSSLSFLLGSASDDSNSCSCSVARKRHSFANCTESPSLVLSCSTTPQPAALPCPVNARLPSSWPSESTESEAFPGSSPRPGPRHSPWCGSGAPGAPYTPGPRPTGCPCRRAAAGPSGGCTGWGPWGPGGTRCLLCHRGLGSAGFPCMATQVWTPGMTGCGLLGEKKEKKP